MLPIEKAKLKEVFYSQILIDNTLIPTETLLGKPKQYVLSDSREIDGSKKSRVFVVKFNTDGQMTNFNAGVFFKTFTYENKHIKQEIYTKDNHESKTTYIYKEERLIKSVHASNELRYFSLYEYTDNRKSKLTSYESKDLQSGYTTYFYTNNQDIIKHYNTDGSLSYQETNTFDYKNNTAKHEYKRDTIIFTRAYQYNSKGVLITYTLHGTTYKLKHTEFDKFGNWTKAETIINGRQIYHSRKILYYK